jgi:plastocyanin
MRIKRRFFGRSALLMAGICGGALQAHAQGADVTAQAKVRFVGPAAAAEHHSNDEVVMWLTPVEGTVLPPSSTTPRTHYQLAQKNKQFVPHLLVVPVGSAVDFPNLDPFFHNVFSQFNGKRFDLGLYESGSSRGVHFDRVGVSFIFCNIHPEMSAVVVAVPTPYYAVSSAAGNLAIHDVAPGTYVAHIWAMGDSETNADALGRRITVSGRNVDLGSIAVTASALAAHKNKFGDNYDDKKPSAY